jgi:hypothetical protein
MSRLLQYIEECETCGCGDPDKVHKKKKKKKKVEEAKAYKNRDVGYIVDEFTRFLIGDREQALRNLKKWIKVEIPIPEDYNKAYKKVFDDISTAIMKTLDV